MRMIEKMYDSVINGDLMGTITDTPETSTAAMRLEGFIDGATNEKQSAIINGLIGDYAYQYGRQNFVLGFKCAMQLMTNADVEE